VQWLPLAVSFACAAVITPAALGLLERRGIVRQNYRGVRLPAAAGVVIVAAALLTLAFLAVIDELAGTDSLRPGLGRVLIYVLGVAALGLIDDLLGGDRSARLSAPRGWRGHARAVVEGRPSTGLLKAVGALALALYVMSGRGRSAGEYLVAVGLLVLTTNFFNLLDLRPGRAAKSFLALGAVLTVATWDTRPLRTLGLFVGAVLALLPFDLRERAMLGDVGSNLLGAVAGLWLLLALSSTGEAFALLAVATITVFGEFRSISALVEKNPLLRRLDSVGRKQRDRVARYSR
jgi:UDP-GlcNAc:undecaprenyl-phosphate/decaprenyl-phosphate GlcNAc-1-phosphate transferase